MNNTNFKTTSIADFPIEEKQPMVKPLSEMMGEANRMLDEALQMAYAINSHMFGKGEPNIEKPCDPECYRDAMNIHVMNLQKLCGELSKIMISIGV